MQTFWSKNSLYLVETILNHILGYDREKLLGKIEQIEKVEDIVRDY